MDRRSLLKTAGLAIAGTALLHLNVITYSARVSENLTNNNEIKGTAPAKRKLCSLEV